MILQDNITAFHHYSLKADDVSKTIVFYEAFGFKQLHEWALPEFHLSRCAMLYNEKIQTYLEICDRDAQMPTQGRFRKKGDEYIENNLLHICFQVIDAEEARTAAITLGAQALSDGTFKLDLNSQRKSVPVVNSLVYGLNGEVIEFLQPAKF